MFFCKTKFKEKLSGNWLKAWLFFTLVAITIVACTSDLDNAGAPLLGPSFGLNIVPQSAQVAKAGTHTFAAIGGLTPYTYSMSDSDIGTITSPDGVFTALLIAGTATITAVDTVGVRGIATVTVLPTQLVVAPGSAIITAAGEQLFTATLIAGGAGPAVASVTRDDSSSTTTLPTVACVAPAACTVTVVTASIPSSGSETYTVTITDQINGDVAAAKLTLQAP